MHEPVEAAAGVRKMQSDHVRNRKASGKPSAKWPTGQGRNTEVRRAINEDRIIEAPSRTRARNRAVPVEKRTRRRIIKAAAANGRALLEDLGHVKVHIHSESPRTEAREVDRYPQRDRGARWGANIRHAILKSIPRDAGRRSTGARDWDEGARGAPERPHCGIELAPCRNFGEGRRDARAVDDELDIGPEEEWEERSQRLGP
ncbi:hypothetical protein DFH09DRAFT_1470379 [Mycena vulgaris]|nr:hypothetical protein DFH09DRAFT_1470379 [Mycena vulgaris]